MKKRVLLPFAALSIVLVAAGFAAVRRPDPATMRPYLLGVLVKGPEWTAQRTPHTDSIQAGHMANIQAMADMGVLLGAGPFAGNERERGLFIFKDIPLDSAAVLVRNDPAVKAQRLLVEFYRWYAPVGIGEAYRERARLRPDHRDSMIAIPMAFLEHPSEEPKLDSLTLVTSTEKHVGMILDQLQSGQMLAGGPVFGNQKLLGLAFYGVDSAAAVGLVKQDPTVQNGHMAVTMRQWWSAWGVLPPKPTVKEMGR